MCLLKYCVLNEMFSFVLIGTYKGNAQCFTLTQHLPSPPRGTRSHVRTTLVPASFPPEKGGARTLLPRPKAQSRPEGGLPQPLAGDIT